MGEDVRNWILRVLWVIALIVAICFLTASVLAQLPLDTIELSERTGWLEIGGWFVAVSLALYGLVLARQRTDALKDSVDATRDSLRLTERSIEATLQQIDLAAGSARHDTETELRKQFRQACLDLIPSQPASARHAIMEMRRLVIEAPDWFADSTLRILQQAVDNEERLDTGLLIDLLATVCAIHENIDRDKTTGNIPQTFSVAGYTFDRDIVGFSLKDIRFRNCQFKIGFVDISIINTSFLNCEFDTPFDAFTECQLYGVNFTVLNRNGDKPTGQTVHFNDCKTFKLRLMSVAPAPEYAVYNFVDCALDGARFIGKATIKVQNCWHNGLHPKIRKTIKMEGEIMDTKPSLEGPSVQP